jgi:hypothetical protein
MKQKAKRNRSSDLSEFFQEMGTAVEREWRNVSYDAARFPDIAAGALEQFKAPQRVDPIDVLRNIDATPLARQQDIEANFSNLPITLFSSTRFYIDLYFWLDGTTSIHQHGFAGAFQVLTGSSLHGHYSFRVPRAVSPHFALGELSLKEVRLLKRGDIKRIVPGPDYIHSLYHLDLPSTTLTIRTIGLPNAQPQFTYLHPGVAFDPFFSDPAIIKRVQSANVLFGMHHSEADAIIGKMLASSDLHTAFALLNMAYGHLFRAETAKLRALSDDAERWTALLDAARARHGDDVDVFAATLAESQRQMTLIRLRDHVTSPDLRFFLALLLNLQERKRILDVVRQRYSHEPAMETVLNWVEELARMKPAFSESNLLGIDGFDDIHLLIIESLSEGKSLTQTQRELRKIFRDEKSELLNRKIQTRYDQLKHNPVLKPLFKA